MSAAPACPLCAGPSELVARHAISVTSGSRVLEAPSTLHLCLACGHTFTRADVDWGAYYAAEYDSVLTDGGMDEIVSMPDGSVAYRTDVDYAAFRRVVGASLDVTTRVLELGCGRGRILSRLVRDGFRRLDAFDLSERYRAPVAAIIGDEHVHVGRRPLGEWDLVVSFFMLEHDEDPRASLEWARSVLADDGRLFLMLPDPTSNLGDFACADHAHHYVPEVLAAFVASCGFDDVVLDRSSPGATALVATKADAPRPLTEDPSRVLCSRAALEPYRAFKARLDGLATRVPPAAPLYLYGAGFYATAAAAQLAETNKVIDGVFDANPKKHGLERLGRTVADPASIPRGRFADATLLVCINERAFPSVRDAWGHHFGAVVGL
jgi:SAM-dependent methyltransferase